MSLVPPFVPHDLSLRHQGPVLSSGAEPGQSTPASCSALEAPPIKKKLKNKAHGEFASIIL